MDRYAIIMRLSDINHESIESGLACEEEVLQIDNCFEELTQIHAIIFSKIVVSFLQVGKLTLKSFDEFMLPCFRFGYWVYHYIEELSSYFPINIVYSESGPVIKVDSNYLKALVGCGTFDSSLRCKTILEANAMFFKVYSSFRSGAISVDYFKKFLLQEIRVENDLELSYILQFFTTRERFIFFRLYLNFLQGGSISMKFHEQNFFKEVCLFEHEDSFSEYFLNFVKFNIDYAGQISSFELVDFERINYSILLNNDIEKTLRVLKTDLFGVAGNGFYKIGIVCKDDTIQRINSWFIYDEHKYLFLRISRFLILDDEVSEVFLKSIIVDIKAFVQNNLNSDRCFVVISDLDINIVSLSEAKRLLFQNFIRSLLSLNIQKLTLVMKLPSNVEFDTHVNYHVEDDEYSIDEMLKKSADRILRLKKMKVV